MERFTTKRHFFRFYILLVLMLLLMAGFGVFVILDFYGKWGTPDFEVGDYLLLLLGGFKLMFILACQTTILSFKTTFFSGKSMCITLGT